MGRVGEKGGAQVARARFRLRSSWADGLACRAVLGRGWFSVEMRPNVDGANHLSKAYGSGSPDAVEPAVEEAEDRAGAVPPLARGSY